MWVKIKSKKIPNIILTVPYSAYLNSYKRKGFIIIEDKNAKNIINNDNIELNKIKSQETIDVVNDINQETKDEQNKIINKNKVEFNLDNSENENKSTNNIKKTSNILNRSPIKKAPVSKR